MQYVPFNYGSLIGLETIAIKRNQLEESILQESKKARDIKANIESTDQEIDKMVYALYELTEEEIGIVEG